MGTSGVGKSTLLALAAGECAPCSMVFQDVRLVEGASALDNVLVCADARVDASSAAALLRLLVPGVDVHARVAELSGGSAVASRLPEPAVSGRRSDSGRRPLPA